MSGGIFYEVFYYASIEAFHAHKSIYREFFRCPKSYALALADIKVKKAKYFTYEILERQY